MKTLRIAKGLALPLDAVTQTLAILARKGSGKTFTARRFAEQLFKAGLQVVDVDPKGDHWGMRSSADGKGPGLGFLILGGEHGDLPLEAGSGELVAKLVVEERVSAILDLSLFRKHEVATFMTAFAENLYRLKAREQYRTPVMLLIDEADAVAPQKPQRGEERMLGAIEDIVRRGRQRGIGCTLVTQRSAVLNKNVLTQAQVMVAMRTIAPQDLAAMDAWIEVHGTPEQRATLMESLPSLPRGDAWVWSPGWPTDDGIFQRVHVDMIETFDSGATPEPGQKRIEPKERADVDLDALRRQMASTVERAKASDPALLRKRIAELERDLAKKPAAVAPAPAKERRVEVPVLKPADIERLGKTVERMGDVAEKLASHAGALRELAGAVVEAVRRAGAPSPAPRPAPTFRPGPEPVGGRIHPRSVPVRPRPEGDEQLGAGERRMLGALALRHPTALTKDQLGTLSGYAAGGGTFRTYLPKLRRLELVVDRGGFLSLTPAGLAEAGGHDAPQTSTEVLETWRRALGQGERRMLDVLVEAYPHALTREELGNRSGFAAAGGTFRTYLPKLRRLRLAEVDGDQVRASPNLME